MSAGQVDVAQGPRPTAGVQLGRYRLEERIGSGGAGDVWRARHVDLGHEVAIKVLAGDAEGEVSRHRFFQEARLSAKLGRSCRHIVRVEDHGFCATDGSTEHPYLVMELLEGETLAGRLRREPPLTLQEVDTIVEQVSQALTVTHAANVVHRDLKPSNIFLVTERGGALCAKLLDFGIARDFSSDRMTRTGSAIGTPGYMSPEQITGAEVDSRSDLWSLSALIFRMLTLTPPFGKGSFEEVTARALWQAPPLPSKVNPALSTAFDSFMLRGLSRPSGERFQTAEALAGAFSAAVHSVAGGAWPAETSLVATTAEVETALAAPIPRRRQLRRLWPLAVVGLGTLALLFWRGSGRTTAPLASQRGIPMLSVSIASPSVAAPTLSGPVAQPAASSSQQPGVAASSPVLSSASLKPARGAARPVSPRVKAKTPAAKRGWLDPGEM